MDPLNRLFHLGKAMRIDRVFYLVVFPQLFKIFFLHNKQKASRKARYPLPKQEGDAWLSTLFY